MQKYTEIQRAPVNTDIKVALVAAASNEAAYVVDWVFHHLHFGFAPLLVYVNRSQDGTEAILRKLAETVPELRVTNIDDVDTDTNGQAPQRTAFERAIARMKSEQGKDDYTMLADIDEFWTPADFTSTIQQVLVAAGLPASATFNWFQLTSDTVAFGPTFAPQITGVHHKLVKAAFRSRLWLRHFNMHGVRPMLPRRIWNASGGRITAKTWFETPEAPDNHGTAFITHRLYRSPLEYLAILGRGRSDFPGLLFKDNRFGYHDLIHRDRTEVTFLLPARQLQDYERGRIEFLAKQSIEPLQKLAQQSVIDRARDVLTKQQALSHGDKLIWKEQFRWLNLRDLSRNLARLPGGSEGV